MRSSSSLLVIVLGLALGACGGSTIDTRAGDGGGSGGGGGAGGSGGAGGFGGFGGGSGFDCTDPSAGWTFTSIPSASPGTRRGLWGSGDADVWMVGPGTDEGHRFDGGTWSDVAMTQQAVFAPATLWGFAPDDVYAAPDYGPLAHFDGQAWTAGPFIPGGRASLWGPAPGTLYFAGAGEGGIVAKLQPDTTWSYEITTGGPLGAIAGSGADDIFAVGPDGDVVHKDASAWKVVANFDPALPGYDSVTSVGSGVAVAVGSTVSELGSGPDAPAAVRLTANGVTRETLPDAPLPSKLTGVWAARADRVFAVSDAGYFLVYDGKSWTVHTLRSVTHLLAVWGSGADHVFFAADEGVWECHAVQGL